MDRYENEKKKDYDAPMSINCTFISTVFEWCSTKGCFISDMGKIKIICSHRLQCINLLLKYSLTAMLELYHQDTRDFKWEEII